MRFVSSLQCDDVIYLIRGLVPLFLFVSHFRSLFLFFKHVGH